MTVPLPDIERVTGDFWQLTVTKRTKVIDDANVIGREIHIECGLELDDGRRGVLTKAEFDALTTVGQEPEMLNSEVRRIAERFPTPTPPDAEDS